MDLSSFDQRILHDTLPSPHRRATAHTPCHGTSYPSANASGPRSATNSQVPSPSLTPVFSPFNHTSAAASRVHAHRKTNYAASCAVYGSQSCHRRRWTIFPCNGCLVAGEENGSLRPEAGHDAEWVREHMREFERLAAAGDGEMGALREECEARGLGA